MCIARCASWLSNVHCLIMLGIWNRRAICPRDIKNRHWYQTWNDKHAICPLQLLWPVLLLFLLLFSPPIMCCFLQSCAMFEGCECGVSKCTQTLAVKCNVNWTEVQISLCELNLQWPRVRQWPVIQCAWNKELSLLISTLDWEKREYSLAFYSFGVELFSCILFRGCCHSLSVYTVLRLGLYTLFTEYFLYLKNCWIYIT